MNAQARTQRAPTTGRGPLLCTCRPSVRRPPASAGRRLVLAHRERAEERDDQDRPDQRGQPGCCIGQASGTGYPGGRLPNSSRQACTVALNGFHSAMCRSTVGMFCEGTKAFEMNVSGNSQISPPEVAASGVRTRQADQRADPGEGVAQQEQQAEAGQHLQPVLVGAPADEHRDEGQHDERQRRSARGRRAYGR